MMDGVTYKGKVSKDYAGFAKEMFTNSDNFSIDCKTFILLKYQSLTFFILSSYYGYEN
jgi:hypothetical protein